MRIALVSNYFPEHVGGVESVAANLCAAYREAGHEVTWMAADVADRPHRGDRPLHAWNLAEERLGFPYPLPSPRSFGIVAREVARADVVHLHDCLYAASVGAFLASRLRSRPALLTQHVGPIGYPNRALRLGQQAAYATLGRVLLAGAEQVTFVSRHVLRHFADRIRFRRPPQLVPNGVDQTVFWPAADEERLDVRQSLGIPSDTRTALFVGRFVWKKGIALIREVALAKPGWSFLFAGRAGDADPRSWRLANVKVLPLRDPAALRELYVAADVLFMPSTGEGFPVSVQEAMSCGTPAVVSADLASEFPGPGLVGAELNIGALADGLEQATSSDRTQVADFARLEWSAEVAAARYLALIDAIRN